MQKFAISRLNLVKKDTFRQYIPFQGVYTIYLAIQVASLLLTNVPVDETPESQL